MITLRDYQEAIVSDIAASFSRGHNAVLAVSPCGSGKTPILARMLAGAEKKNISALATVPRVDLMRQTVRTLDMMGVRGQLDTIQTRRRGPLTDRLIIVDEAHWGFSPAWIERMQAAILDGAKVIGFTASPIPGMDAVFTDMVMGPSVSLLMARGYLSRYRAFGPSQPDLSSLPVRAGEYAPGPSAELMSKPAIVGDNVKAWRELAHGKRTIGYAVSREHSRKMVAAFNAAGIPAEHVDGDTPHDERAAIFARFARRETLVLFNVALFQLGLDLSSIVGEDVPIEAMIDDQPTKSIPLQVQKWGRVMRPKPDAAIILDHANNFRDLGLFPDDDMDWSISAGVTRRSVNGPAISICARCFGAFRTAPVCPYCQSARELTPREVEQRDGELRELERVATAKARRIEVGRADGLDGLVKIAKERGYKVGWIVQRMKLKGTPVAYEAAVRAMGRV